MGLGWGLGGGELWVGWVGVVDWKGVGWVGGSCGLGGRELGGEGWVGGACGLEV